MVLCQPLGELWLDAYRSLPVDSGIRLRLNINTESGDRMFSNLRAAACWDWTL